MEAAQLSLRASLLRYVGGQSPALPVIAAVPVPIPTRCFYPSFTVRLQRGCASHLSDHICCHNERYAEYWGYWKTTSFPRKVRICVTVQALPLCRFCAILLPTVCTALIEFLPLAGQLPAGITELTFYDVSTGRPLFIAPKGRSFEEFYSESTEHGWPSFRDEEVLWENVLIRPGGETVSVNGTHVRARMPLSICHRSSNLSRTLHRCAAWSQPSRWAQQVLHQHSLCGRPPYWYTCER